MFWGKWYVTLLKATLVAFFVLQDQWSRNVAKTNKVELNLKILAHVFLQYKYWYIDIVHWLNDWLRPSCFTLVLSNKSVHKPWHKHKRHFVFYNQHRSFLDYSLNSSKYKPEEEEKWGILRYTMHVSHWEQPTCNEWSKHLHIHLKQPQDWKHLMTVIWTVVVISNN